MKNYIDRLVHLQLQGKMCHIKLHSTTPNNLQSYPSVPTKKQSTGEQESRQQWNL
jgi:hypothetical protein